jgi:hypothetical protein
MTRSSAPEWVCRPNRNAKTEYRGLTLFEQVAAGEGRDLEAPACHFLVTPISVSGSQVARAGNAVMMAMHTSIIRKKGSDASAT